MRPTAMKRRFRRTPSPIRSCWRTAAASRRRRSGGSSAGRRIVELFDREVYGRVPENVPAVHWEVTGVTEEAVGEYRVIVKKLVGRADNSEYRDIEVAIDATLTIPTGTTGPVPV